LTDTDFAPKIASWETDQGIRRRLLRKAAGEAQSGPENAAEQLPKAFPHVPNDVRYESGGAANRG